MTRSAVVTGAAGGIGTAVCLALARAGCDVVGVGRSLAALAQLEDTARGAGLTVRTRPADVTSEQAVAELVDEYGSADILVHCAGRASSSPVAKESLANWEAMHTVNATSAFLLARAFVGPMLLRDHGRIVMIASTLAHVGERYTASYAAAKHAVLGLARVVASEVAGTGVTCNCVCPTYVRTAMTEQSVTAMAARSERPVDEIEAALARRSPLGRLVEPVEVAAAVLAFTDPDAGAINGQSLVLDGGGLQR